MSDAIEKARQRLERAQAKAHEAEEEITRLRREERRREQEREAAEIRCFREGLEAEYGLTDCIVASALWDIAWGEGHSEGLNSVEWHYRDLAERLVVPLIKPTP